MAKTERPPQGRRRALRSLASLLSMLLCGCLSHEPTVIAPQVRLEPGVSSSAVQWVVSEDGVLALRLLPASGEVARGATIEVVAQLRNASQMPVTVLRPFGDWHEAQAVGLKIWDSRGQLRYAGPVPTYVIGGNAFAVLAPGEVVEDRLELMNENFPGLVRPGTYTLRHDYSYQGNWDVTAAAGNSGIRHIWRGTITSREAQVIRR